MESEINNRKTRKFGRSMLSHWMLDPAITYLNHGTVGSPPRRVLASQQRLRDEIERQPSRFLLRELAAAGIGVKPPERPRMREAANAVAEFLGVQGRDLVFVDNATSGINAVLSAFDFREGDELVILNQAYGAVRNAAEYATRRSGAKVRVAEVPDVIRDPEEVVAAVESAIGPRTRIAVIDHITADSALVMPLAEIAERCRRRGVAVVVDGAHAPGAIPLDIASLRSDWYVGNLHKWAWSPRSCGIMWVDPERQASLHHTVISWGLDKGISDEFDWPGTRDPTPHLAAPDGIRFMRELGVEAVQGYNHELAVAAGEEMSRHWRTGLLGPVRMIGTMVTVPLPEGAGGSAEDAARLREALLVEKRVEAHVYARGGRVHVRVSGQVYNEMADVERLIEAVDELCG